MSATVLFRSTTVGTIELDVSELAETTAEVARCDGWDRGVRPDPLWDWRDKLRLMDEADRKRRQRRRKREAPMTDVGCSAATVTEAFPLEPDEVAIEAMRGNAKKADVGPYPKAGQWYVLSCRDRVARGRGTPGNTAPGD